MPRINPGSGIAGAEIGQALQNRSADNPIVYSQDIQGGLTNVTNEAGRLALPPRKLQPGMIVHQESDDRYYRFTYSVDHNADPRVPLVLQPNGDFNYPTAPTMPARTLVTSWEPIQFNAIEPAIFVNTVTNMPEFDPQIDANEVRDLLQINPQGAILSFTLTTAAMPTLTGGINWGGSSTGTITHADITQGAIVFLNGVQLREGTGNSDYQVSGTTITLGSDIRGAIVDDNMWCVTVVDEVDSGTAGTGTGRVEDRRAQEATATITSSQLTNIGTTPIVRAPIANSNNSTYTVIAGVAPLFSVVVDTMGDWAVSSIRQGTTELGFEAVDGQDHEWAATFSGSADNITITLVGTNEDSGIFYVNSADNTNIRLDNVPPTIEDVQLLGFDTTDDLDDRYLQDDSTDPYQTQSSVATTITDTIQVRATRGTTFPADRAPETGDQHFLTAAIYPDGTMLSTQEVPQVEGDTGTTMGVMRSTVRDPNRGYDIVAGTYEVTDTMRDAPPEDRTVIITGGAGRRFNRNANRDRSYQGINVSTNVRDGGNIVTTSVVEHRYSNVGFFNNGIFNPVRNATLHDYYYRQTVRTGIVGFAAVRRNVHYITIQFSDGGSIGTVPTQANAITLLEGFASGTTTPQIDLVQGASLPLEFTTTSAFTGHTATVFESPGQLQFQTYTFIPMNDFTIDRTRTTVNQIAIPDSDYAADGSVTHEVNGNNVQPWQVRFVRTFNNVPPVGTDPESASGQYVYTDQWRRLDFVT